MVDTGANVEVCHSLERNCLSNSDVPGHKTISGFKDRARGRLITTELPIHDSRYQISCVQALETYLAMSKRLSKKAPTELKRKLFLHRFEEGRIGRITYRVAERQFQNFLARHKELCKLKLCADMIRPSVLFQMIYKNNGNLTRANAIANHSRLSTTGLYADRPSLHLIYELLTREFQGLFQTVSISNIDGAARKLDIDESQFRKLMKRAHRTGLGVACLNPKAGYQPGTTKGQTCDALQNCPRCPFRFVIATVPSITDLILFHRHLQMSQSEFEATRPQRWLDVWLPWLIFTEVALEKVQRGNTAPIYLKAKRIAESRIASESVNFAPLW
jgi:hypothetical protein